MSKPAAIEVYKDHLDNVIYYRKLIVTARAPEDSHRLSVEIAVTSECNIAVVWERVPPAEAVKAEAQWRLVDAAHNFSAAVEKGIDEVNEALASGYYVKTATEWEETE